MSMVRVYLYGIGQKVIIPQMVENDLGVFSETAPVQVFEVSDIAGWKSLIYKYLSQGNKLVPTPEDHETPGSAILEKLKLAKWSDFEKNAVLYTIHRGPRWTAIYATGRNADGRWTTGEKERRFDSSAPLEVVIDEAANDLMKEPEAVERPVRLLLGGPTTPPQQK